MAPLCKPPPSLNLTGQQILRHSSLLASAAFEHSWWLQPNNTANSESEGRESVWMWVLLQTTFGTVCPSSFAAPFLSVLCLLLTALPSASSPYPGSLAAAPHKQSPSLLITLLKKLFLFFLTAPSSCATAELCWFAAHGGMA